MDSQNLTKVIIYNASEPQEAIFIAGYPLDGIVSEIRILEAIFKDQTCYCIFIYKLFIYKLVQFNVMMEHHIDLQYHSI